MAARIPIDVFRGFSLWMASTPFWAGQFQIILDKHTGQWCDHHGIDTFEQLAFQIGSRRVTTLKDHAFMDFLGCDTPVGNPVDLYLKERGHRERKAAKAYLEGCRDSIMGLYEVSHIEPGKSFLARDLLGVAEPMRVQERTATRSLRAHDQAAMRIVKLRGTLVVAGDILCLPPDCIAYLVNDIDNCASSIAAETANDHASFFQISERSRTSRTQADHKDDSGNCPKRRRS